MFESLTNAQRRFLTGLGVTNMRRAIRKETCRKMTLDANRKLRGNLAVLWADNYNRLRYRANPMYVQEGHINATAMALTVALPMQPTWGGQPLLPDLLRNVDTIAAFVAAREVTFTDDVKVLVNAVQRHTDFRVPCDLKRWDVTSVEWMPYAIKDAAIGSMDGLMDVLEIVRQVAESLELSPMAILSDVNIFYRIHKILHTKSFWMCGAHRGLQRLPLLFGAWHSYAHVLKRTYAVFRPWWCALSHEGLMDDYAATDVYNHPKIVFLEHTVVTAFLNVRVAVVKIGEAKAAQTDLTGKALEDRNMQLHMLELLLCEYIPAIMELGIGVRELYWGHRDPGSGCLAKSLLAKILVVTAKLEQRGNSDYRRALALALLGWTDIHDQIPAAFYVEEALEASLSRLAKATSQGHQVDDVAQLSALYCGQCRPSTRLHDLDKPGFSKAYVKLLKKNIPKLVRRCAAGRLAYLVPKLVASRGGVQKINPHVSIGSSTWPPKYAPQVRRLLLVGNTDFRVLLLQSLKAVVQEKPPKRVAQDTSAILQKLCAGLHPLTDAQMQPLVTAEQKLVQMLRKPPAAKPRANKKPRIAAAVDVATSSSSAARRESSSSDATSTASSGSTSTSSSSSSSSSSTSSSTASTDSQADSLPESIADLEDNFVWAPPSEAVLILDSDTDDDDEA